MKNQENTPVSPVVKTILTEFSNNLKSCDEFDKDSVENLDKLLQSGNIPKIEELDKILFQPANGGNKS